MSSLNNIDKGLLSEKVYKSGFDYEKTMKGCGQATTKAVIDYFNVDDKIFKSLSTCYGGICGCGTGPCGGYIAGAILISYLFGRDINNTNLSGSRFKDRELVKKLRQKYYDVYGGETCRDVQKKIFGRYFNINDEEDKKAFEESGAHIDKCPHVVGTAAKWICEIIIENMDDENIILKRM